MFKVICLQYNPVKFDYTIHLMQFECTKEKFQQSKIIYESDNEKYLYTLYDNLNNEIDFFTSDKFMLF